MNRDGIPQTRGVRNDMREDDPRAADTDVVKAGHPHGSHDTGSNTLTEKKKGYRRIDRKWKSRSES